MRRNLVIQSAWSRFLTFIALVAGAFVLTSVISTLILLSRGTHLLELKNLDYSNPKLLNTLKLIQGISTITIFLLPSLVFAMIAYRGKNFYYLGFRKPDKMSFIFLAILVVFFSFPFVSWLGELNQHVHLSKWMVESEKEASRQMQAFLQVNNTTDIIINVLLVALLPAICEEVFFRGCLQRILIEGFKNPWMGIIITAALFSAFHMQFAGFLPRMFLGILLGAFYWYSNSLWTNIFAHFIYNAIQVIAVVFYPKMIDENPSVPVYAALVSGCIVFVIVYMMKRQSTVSFEKAYERENEQDKFGF